MPTSFFTVPQPAGELEIPTTSGEIVPLEGMADAAFRRLIDRFRKPRTKELLSAVVEEVQLVEDAVEQVYFNTLLINATGVNLDVIGRRVGEPRAGRADGPYQAAIRTAILANISEGRVEDYIRVCTSMVPASPVRVWEFYPGAVSIRPRFLDLAGHSGVVTMLTRAKSAGVRLEITHGPSALGTEDGSILVGLLGSDDDVVTGFSMASTT